MSALPFLTPRGLTPRLTTNPTPLPTRYLPKRDVMVAALRRAGFHVGPVPQGAYYIMAGYKSVPPLANLKPMDASMKLITDYGVASGTF